MRTEALKLELTEEDADDYAKDISLASFAGMLHLIDTHINPGVTRSRSKPKGEQTLYVPYCAMR
jgi:hypothetical protein